MQLYCTSKLAAQFKWLILQFKWLILLVRFRRHTLTFAASYEVN
nr:MAG TPA: hypothetical protein [Caudoviricetes sp.]